jgi:hypothetical protein
MLWLVICWLFLCVLIGIAADRHFDRSGIAWFVLAFFFSPLVALLVLLALGRPRDGGCIHVKGDQRLPSNEWLWGSPDRRPWSASHPLPSRRAKLRADVDMAALQNAVTHRVQTLNGK